MDSILGQYRPTGSRSATGTVEEVCMANAITTLFHTEPGMVATSFDIAPGSFLADAWVAFTSRAEMEELRRSFLVPDEAADEAAAWDGVMDALGL